MPDLLPSRPELDIPAATPIDAGSQALSEALRSSFAIVKFLMLVLVAVFLASGFFIVGPQQRAIILRFGKPVAQGEKALLGPGLHFSLPYPIDEVRIVSITGIQQVQSSVGWYATTPEMELAQTEPPPMPTLNPAIDGYLLTSDDNIVHSRATLTYRISDPIRFVFGFVNASNAVQAALDDALVYAAAHFKVDDILTRDPIGFNEAVQRRATELIEQRNLGIVIEQCVASSIAPRQVKDAFASVIKAEINRNTALTVALNRQNEITNKANADAQSLINLAQSERALLVNDVNAQSKRFQELLPQYRENPSLFVQKRLTDTLGRALTNVQDKIFVSEGSRDNPKEMRYLFNREAPKPPKPEEKK
jgi:membrane protease subunit HflK